MKKIFTVCVLFISITLFSSCFLKPTDEAVHFDNTAPLSLAPDVEWAVVTDPYIGFHETPAWESAVPGYCRRGDVLQVEGRKLVETDEGQLWWYAFDQGWLPQTSVAIYSNRFKALTGSAELTQ
jgi:hypothetical protein